MPDTSALDAPVVLDVPAQHIAVVRLTVPRAEMRTVMGPGLTELRAAVTAQGMVADGPWFTHHLRLDPAVFDFEIGVVVDAPLAPIGRVQPSVWPAGRAARTVHRGAFEGLGAAWGAFDAWIAAAGHAAAPELWERYLAGPESGRDPAGWRTELTRPLREAA